MTPAPYSDDDPLVDDLLTDTDIETSHMPAGRQLRRQAKREYIRIQQQQQLLDAIPRPPEPGWSIHAIGTGLYDFWTFVPQILTWLTRADELYCSTWTLARPNATELFSLLDAGRVAHGRTAFLMGEYFKRRETAVYTMLVDGLRSRGGRFRAFMNHAKVLLASSAALGAYLVCEGSANLTGNPRLEQYVFTNDRGLYDFHRSWMEEMLNA